MEPPFLSRRASLLVSVIEALADPVRIAYAAAFFLSGVLCLLLIPRAKAFENGEVQTGLVWLLATTGGWGVLKTAYLLLPVPFGEPTYTIGLIIGFATVWAWLYFCSAYTARPFHRNPMLRRLSVALFGLVALVSYPRLKSWACVRSDQPHRDNLLVGVPRPQFERGSACLALESSVPDVRAD